MSLFGLARPEAPAGAAVFTMHKQSGVGLLFGILAGLSLIEAGGVHLILTRRHHLVAAWVLTLLSVYGAFFFLSVARSFARLPITVTAEILLIRVGLLWSVEIARDNIAQAGPASPPVPSKQAAGYLAAHLLADPNVMIRLREPVTAKGLYGRTKTVTVIGISADAPEQFITALKA